MPLIRLADPRDAAQIRAIYAPFCRDDSPVSFETEPPSVDAMRQRITKTLDRLPWLACDDADELLGYVYASPHIERAAYRWSVNVSVYILEGRRRGGIGRALYTSLFNLLKLQGYYKAFAGTTIPNPGSVGLHQSMGFEPVGIYRNVGYKGGAWHDTAWWQLSLQEPAPCPEEPLSLRDLEGKAGWDAALAGGLTLLRESSQQ